MIREREERKHYKRSNMEELVKRRKNTIKEEGKIRER